MVLVSIIFLLGLSLLSLALSTLKNGITPTPSSSLAIEAMLKCAPEDAKVIYDLGAGFGGLCIKAAKKFPNAQVIGIENSFVPFIIAFLRQKIGRVKNLRIVKQNFLDADFDALADIPKETYQEIEASLRNSSAVKKPKKVFLAYLCTGAMERLKPKMKKELVADNVLISNFFKMRGWEEKSRCGVFIYTSNSVLSPLAFSQSMIASDS